MNYAKILICAIVSFYALGALSVRVDGTDLTINAEDNASDTLRVSVFYDIADSRHKASARLTEVCETIDSLLEDESLKNVHIQGFSSPSGPEELNGRLSRRRAEDVRKYLLSNSKLSPSMAILSAHGEDWAGFRGAIVADSLIEGKKMILDVIDSNLALEAKERVIRSRISRRDWQRMCDHIFPKLRKTDVLVLYRSEPVSVVENQSPVIELESVSEIETEEIVCPDSLPNVLPAPVIYTLPNNSHSGDEALHWHLKTNVPAWAMLWLNIAAEFDFVPHWSAQLPIYYSGFDYFKRTRKYRLFSIMPEVRWWPRSCNNGFFAGAHFGLAYYNFAFGGEYRYQDHDGNTPALGGGVTVGYRLPVSRNHRWQLEFSVGAGVYSLNYDLFYNVPNGQLAGHRTRTFFGIDNVAISIGYQFNLSRKLSPAQKGGAQ